LQKLWNSEGMVKNAEGKLLQEGYAALNRRIHRALVPGVDDESCDVAARADWISDAAGESSMSYGRFSEAMFELADLWSAGAEESEYCTFMSNVEKCVCDVYEWINIREQMTHTQ
jgi:hypothetical protein